MRQYLDRGRRDDAWFRRDDSLPTKTWKELFRIAHNWRVGRARTTRLPLRSSVLPEISLSKLEDLDGEESPSTAEPAGPSSRPATASRQTQQQQHAKVVWHGQHYFVASNDIQEGGLPSIDVFQMTATSDNPTRVASIVSNGLKGKDSPGSLSISEMQLDAAAIDGNNGIRLAVFYSNGQFSLFRIRNTGSHAQGQINISEEYFSSLKSSRSTVMARLHSPILVTSSSDCSVRFRFIEETRNKDTGMSEISISLSPPTMRTTLCFAPMTMRLTRKEEPSAGFARLKAQQGPQRFQLSLAYSTPYYPAAFTVGLQVFNITVPPKNKGNTPCRRPLEVFVRSAIAVPPSSDVPGEHNQAIINTIEHDGPYIVASRSDNTISVYEVLDALSDSWLSTLSTTESPPPSPAKMNAIPLKLRHVRMLFGHTAAVDAVGLLDGKCVSTGRDGIKVWELPHWNSSRHSIQSQEEGDVDEDARWRSNIPISERDLPEPQAASTVTHPSSRNKCQWIGLDTSRIVTVCSDESAEDRLIKVYHFE